jgi:UDP-N-acetylmuramoyl-L-alanyl-D-glutamate--2,6-diaminopimelate ligase
MFKLLVYRLKRPFHFFKTGLVEGVPAHFAAKKYLKKLTVIGITGTDGKTTTSTLAYQLLQTAGIKTGLISTVGGYVGDQVIDTGLHVTSPTPRQLYRLLTMMADKGCTHVVLEATSHGLYQYRFWGLKPQIVGVTNITHEHLDYHVTWQEYVKAKYLLLKNARSIYLNGDDSSYAVLHKMKWSKKQKLHKYDSQTGLPAKLKTAIAKHFPETYNRQNAMLAWLIAEEAGVTPEQAAKGIAAFTGVPGRMEVVVQAPITAIVDFAHTPNALEKVLTAVREVMPSSSRLICVFGCAGLRDVAKRPMMGNAAARLADYAIFTAEDPRTEDIWSIIRQMKSGVVSGHSRVITIPDRFQAIEFALTKLARRGDYVLVCGKGHEQSMCFGTEEVPWHDPSIIRQILKEKK